MKIEGPGKAITVYIGEADRWHGKPLVNALVERLRSEGFARVTLTRGVLGFGVTVVLLMFAAGAFLQSPLGDTTLTRRPARRSGLASACLLESIS